MQRVVKIIHKNVSAFIVDLSQLKDLSDEEFELACNEFEDIMAEAISGITEDTTLNVVLAKVASVLAAKG